MALNRRVEPVALDVSNDYTGGVIWGVRGERNSLELDIELSQAGSLIDLTGTATTFRYLTSQGYKGENCMGTDNCFKTEQLGHLRVLVSQNVFVESGISQCAVEIFDPVAGILVKTPPFRVHVLDSL